MANIGRAYCHIMPTTAALLRDILRKEKKEIQGGRDEKARGFEVGRCPGCRCYKCLRTAGRFSIMYKYIYELWCHQKCECNLRPLKEGAGKRKPAWISSTSVYCFLIDFLSNLIDLSFFSQLLLYKYFAKFVAKKQNTKI
jgi:hypothetical protein